MEKLNRFAGVGVLACLMLYLDSYRRMYDSLVDIDKVAIAGGLFFVMFVFTTLSKEK
jgi:hypothetical protein|tara:strand:+ start:674 stop:844 length:171 start_codon:yes stop_codon:yes gene_type:complete